MSALLRRKLADPARLLGPIAFLTAFLAIYLPLSLAGLLPAGALLALIARTVGNRPAIRLHFPSLACLAGLLLVATASLAWSYAADETLSKLPRTAATVALGVFFIAATAAFQDREKRVICDFLVAGFAVAVVVILAERVTGGIVIPSGISAESMAEFMNKFNRVLTLLAMLVWPVAVRLARIRLRFGILAVAATLATMLLFNNNAAIAALMLGGAIYLCGLTLPKATAILMMIVFAASIVLAPTISRTLPEPKALFTEMELPRSSYHRLLIWRFTAEKIQERPVLGWGFNTSRAIPGGQKSLDVSEAALPLHPHNAALQIRLEMGLLGVLFAAGLAATATWAAYRHSRGRVERAGALATTTAGYTIAMLSFGIWQSWWVSALFLTAAYAVAACGGRQSTPAS